MEIFACVSCGLTLIACSIGLTFLRAPNWQEDGELLEEHQRAIERWAKLQRRVRQLNNALFGLIGAAMIGSIFVPRGRSWLVLWCAILVLLLFCILFAMVDAFSSMAAYRRALPEAARRTLKGSRQR